MTEVLKVLLSNLLTIGKKELIVIKDLQELYTLFNYKKEEFLLIVYF
jgi:hypothetical protein